MFVVDASITLAWCLDDEASEAADRALARLESEEAVAPSVWPLEVANGLLTAERRGRLDISDVARVRDLLLALPVGVEAVDLGFALTEVNELARTLGLSAYDAAYLALAARRGLELATADSRLRQAALTAGVALAG
jgi:predicted nucleic acid-binding protein